MFTHSRYTFYSILHVGKPSDDPKDPDFIPTRHMMGSVKDAALEKEWSLRVQRIDKHRRDREREWSLRTQRKEKYKRDHEGTMNGPEILPKSQTSAAEKSEGAHSLTLQDTEGSITFEAIYGWYILYVHLSICLSLCQSVYLPACLSVCLSVYLPTFCTYPSLSLSFYLSTYICLSLFLQNYLFVHVCVCVCGWCRKWGHLRYIKVVHIFASSIEEDGHQ